MLIQKILFLLSFSLSIWATSFLEQFKQTGCVEIYNQLQRAETFDALYASFDELISFLRKNPAWANKLYIAKERFIRSKDQKYYSTDFFGFYDEADRIGRRQTSFYYSSHFHEFIFSRHPEFTLIPEISHFFTNCFEIQKVYGNLFKEVAHELNLNTIFISNDGHPPTLFKVVKYLPSYIATKPHYDGSAFSLFLDSTDNTSLFLSPYKSLLTVNDFYSPDREFQRGHSILLIPGTHLTEFEIYPTPHIVLPSSQIRYAAIVFAMRPNYTSPKIEYTPLPYFQH